MPNFDEREAAAIEAARQRRELEEARERRALEEAALRRELAEADRRGYLADTGLGVVRGVTSAAEESMDALASIDEWLGKNIGVIDLNPFDGDGIGFDEFEEGVHQSPFRHAEEGYRLINDDLLPETDTAVGGFADAATRLVGGFVATRGMSAWGQGSRIATWGINATRAAIADFAVFDGHEERASDFLIEFDNPVFNNAVTQYLAVNGEDNTDVGELEGRMKNVLEGAGLGVMADGIVRSFKALRLGRRWTAARSRYNTAKAREAEIQKRIDETGDTDPFLEDATFEDFGFTRREVEVSNTNAVEATSRSTDSTFHTVRDSDGNLRVISKNDSVEGGMSLNDRGEYLQVGDIALREADQGKGYGVAILEEGIDFAFGLGKKFASDTQLTPAAVRSWRSLERRGYNIRKADHAVDPDGNFVSTNGEPLYRVEGLPEGAFSNGNRLDSKVTRISHSSSADEIATEINRVATDPNASLRVDFDALADDPAALVKFMDALEVQVKQVLKTTERVAQSETIAKAQAHLAERYGDEAAARLYGDVTADDGLAARVVATDNLAIAGERRMIELAKRAGATTATDLDRAALLQQVQATAMLDAQARGAKAEAARAVRAMAITKNARNANNFEFEELIREVGQTGDVNLLAKKIVNAQNDPAALSHLVRQSMGDKVSSVLQEIFYGNVLSAPSTQLANIFGNTWKVAENLIQRTIALGVHAVRSPFPGQKLNPARVDEFRGAFVGIAMGVKESLRFSIKSVLRDAHTKGFQITKATKAERIQFYNEQEGLGTAWRALLSGEPQIDALTKLTEAGGSRRAIEWNLPENLKDRSLVQQAAQRGMALLVNTTGGIVRLPGKALVTTDEIFKTLASNTERYSLAYGDAAALARADKSRSVHEIASDLLSNGAYLKEGREFARSQTFQQKLGKIGTAVENVAASHPSLRFIVPFVRTPTNIVKDAYSYVPIANLLSKSIRADLRAGGRQADMAIAKLTMSAGFAYQSYEWFAEDRLVGGGSDKNSSRLGGVKPYSVFVFGEWHQFNRLDPLGMVLGFYADMFETAGKVSESPEGEELEAAVGGFMAAVASNITSKTYLRGISDLMAAMSDAERGAVEGMKEWTGSMLGNLMPLVGSNFERRRAAGQDDFSRYIFNWADEFRSRIPEGGLADKLGLDTLVGGTRQDLGARRDPLGRSVEEALDLTKVIQESEESNNRLDRVLANLDFNISMPSRNISGVGLNSNQYSKLLYLRGQEVRIAGRTMEEALQREIDSPLYERRSIVGQQERVNDIVREYGRRARDQLRREDPELDAKIDEASARKKAESGVDLSSIGL